MIFNWYPQDSKIILFKILEYFMLYILIFQCTCSVSKLVCVFKTCTF